MAKEEKKKALIELYNKHKGKEIPKVDPPKQDPFKVEQPKMNYPKRPR